MRSAAVVANPPWFTGEFALTPSAVMLYRRRSCFAGGAQRLIEVPQNILDLFDSDGQPDHVVCNSASLLLFVAQLLVRRGCRMNHQALCIADVGQMREQLQAFYKTFSCV